MPPAVVTAPRQQHGGCILGCLSTLVLLLILLGLTWFLALRPYLHNTASTQIDNAMSAVVNQIPASVTQIPPGGVLPVRENVLNNLLVLNIAPSDPVQNTNIRIMTNGIRLDFQLYGQLCTITGVPQARHGNLVATNVTVSGIVGLIMSAADVTALLNKHLAHAQARIHHTVRQVHLMNAEVDLVLG